MRQVGASLQHNSWQIPLAQSQKCDTNASSPNKKEEQEEDGDEPDPDEDETKKFDEIDEEVTTNSEKSYDVENQKPDGL